MVATREGKKLVKRRAVCLIPTVAGKPPFTESSDQGGAVERVADLTNLPTTGSIGPWLGRGPDDSLLLLKDIGTQDTYALDWEEP